MCQHQLKSDIWAAPGRHRGFTREKKPFRRISGACFGSFWLHFGPAPEEQKHAQKRKKA